MTLRQALFALCCGTLALACAPAAPVAAATVAEQAQAAAVNLQKAVTALDTAREGKDRIRALTQTITAYEQGLTALRESLRQASIREESLLLQFQAKRDRVAQLIGVLSQLESDPAPLLLLHPTGPLGTVRSGIMIADVTPGLQAEAEALRLQLQEVRDLRALQTAAGKTLAEGLRAIHANDHDYAEARFATQASQAELQSRAEYKQVFRRKHIEAEHPVVHIHAETGEKSLLLGQFVKRFVGLNSTESAAILALLHERLLHPQNTVRWQWQPGDIAVWDNHATLHVATNDYGDVRRVVRRVTVSGHRLTGVDGRQSEQLAQA